MTPIEALRRVPAQKVSVALERTARRFLDPAASIRKNAVSGISDQTGFSKAMAEQALDWTFSEITVDRMRNLLISELDGEDSADDPALPAPKNIFLIAAGAIFQPFVNTIVHSLLVKSPIVVKCSSHESVLLPLFAETLREIEPDAGNAVRAERWPSKESEKILAAVRTADHVVAYGSDETIAAIRSTVPVGTNFFGHGHKVSATVIGAGSLRNEAEARSAAMGTALDVAMYDQSGCLSPQCVYVEAGAPVGIHNFSRMLAAELEAIGKKLPPGKLGGEQACAIRALRAEFEFLSSQDESIKCFFGEGLSYSVVTDSHPEFRSSPLGRTIFVKPLEGLERLPQGLSPAENHLQGIAATPLSDLKPVMGYLEKMGGSYFCEPGRLQRPPLDWANGGIPCLRGLLKS